MFDFLEDCGEQAARNAIGEQLQSDSAAFFADCESALDKACAAPIAESLRTLDKELVDPLTKLAKHARRCADTLPMPRGVFVSAEERIAVYKHLMDALPKIHRQARAVEQATTGFLRLDRWIDARRRQALVTENRLRMAQQICPESQACASLLDRLQQENAQANACVTVARKQVELLLGFSKRTVISFFARAEQVADLANGGRAADPAGTANLLERLGREADLLIDEILLSQNK